MKTIEDLIPKIMAKTNDGSLRWKPTTSPGTYEADLAKNVLRVWEWEDPEDGTEGISIGLFKGIENLDFVHYDKYSSQFEKFRLLYAAARRSALELDKIVDELEQELDQL